MNLESILVSDSNESIESNRIPQSQFKKLAAHADWIIVNIVNGQRFFARPELTLHTILSKTSLFFGA